MSKAYNIGFVTDAVGRVVTVTSLVAGGMDYISVRNSLIFAGVSYMVSTAGGIIKDGFGVERNSEKIRNLEKDIVK